MGVNGERRAGGAADALVTDADIEDGIFDMQLDGRGFALERDDGVSCGERVDGGLQEIVGGVTVQVAVGLGEGDEFGSTAKGVEGESTVLFREAEVFCDLWGEGSAVGLFLEKLGIDGWRLRVIGVVGGLCVGSIGDPSSISRMKR